MRAGELVELRPPSEILAGLDAAGALDGVPFMPEMLDYYGKAYRVQARVERACDTVNGGIRRLPGTVLLDDLRCSGAAHAGCQAACRIYWKEEWLRPASGASTPLVRDDAYAELERLTRANVNAAGSTPESPTYSCQATQWVGASEPVGWWSVRSFASEVTGGNVGPWRFVSVMTRVVFGEIGRRLGLISRHLFMPRDPTREPFVAPPPQTIAPGEVVRVKSRSEIAQTLDANGKYKGLWFDREMLPFCGRTAEVGAKIERFVDESNGKLIEIKSDLYLLKGVVCGGDRSDGRWFCPRAIHPWWREAWLERSASSGDVDATSVERARED